MDFHMDDIPRGKVEGGLVGSQLRAIRCWSFQI